MRPNPTRGKLGGASKSSSAPGTIDVPPVAGPRTHTYIGFARNVRQEAAVRRPADPVAVRCHLRDLEAVGPRVVEVVVDFNLITDLHAGHPRHAPLTARYERFDFGAVFATYIAVSAAAIMAAGAVAKPLATTMPIDAERGTVVARLAHPELTATRTRVATSAAARFAALPPAPRSSQSTTNSSPPTRATVSDGRTACAMQPAIIVSTSSPV